MNRWIYAYRHISGSTKALEEALLTQSMALLRAATGSPAEEQAVDGSYLLELHAKVAGVEVAKKVRVRTGVGFRSGSRVILPISWHADPGKHAFPVFEGTIELEALDSRSAHLYLVGSYGAPLGPLGAVADTVLLRAVGQATADTIVHSLGAHLSEAARTGAAPERTRARDAAMRVRDVMTPDPLVIDEDLPLRSAALLLFYARVSGAPVVTDSGELIGVLSEADLLAKEATRQFGLGRKAREEDRRRSGRTAGDACTRPARSTAPDVRLTEVVRTMLDDDVNRLVVVDEGRIAGIVTRHDALAALIRADSEIELAVREAVQRRTGADLHVAVEGGDVTLRGEIRLRSEAERLPDAVGEIDGVMSVDAERLTWLADDVIPMAHM